MRPLLITSLGNPGAQYAATRHSAGHILLKALVSQTGAVPLSNVDARYKGPMSVGTSSTIFWQSPHLMNVSGSGVARAWRTFCADNTDPNNATLPLPRLVILHDELELNLGKYKIRTTIGASARGHNGLKSVLSMPGMNKLDIARVAVGIGPRPESRAGNVVADFVLSKMPNKQREVVEGLAGDVWGELDKLRQP